MDRPLKGHNRAEGISGWRVRLFNFRPTPVSPDWGLEDRQLGSEVFRYRRSAANGGYQLTRFRVVALLAILFLLGARSSSRDAHRDAIILDMMEAAGIPGLQTAVIKDGHTVWTKSYGYAVLDRPGPRRAMTNDSILWSASVGKILVTTAVLQQVEKGPAQAR